MEAEFDENDTTRTRLWIVIKAIRRQEEQSRKQQAFMIKVWAWFKAVLSHAVGELKRSDNLLKWLGNVLAFAHSQAEKIRIED